MYTIRLEDHEFALEFQEINLMEGDDAAQKPGPLGQGVEHPSAPTPWVAASETLPDCTQLQSPVDELEEALMESFPCSDPPSHGVCHA